MATTNDGSVSGLAGAEVDLRFFGAAAGVPDGDSPPAVDAAAAAEQQRGSLISCAQTVGKLSFAYLPMDQSVRLLAGLWTSFQQLKGALHTQASAQESIPVEVRRNYKAMQHRINLIRSAKIIAKCSQQPDALVVHSNDVQAKIRHMTKYGSVSRAFYSIDVSAILAKYDAFRQLLPEVQPEVKAQTTGDHVLLSLFHQLGAGFRLQSTADAELVMTTFGLLRGAGLLDHAEMLSVPMRGGANNNGQAKMQSFTWDVAPIRAPSHVRAALLSGVRTFLVDSVDEAVRIQKAYKRLACAANGGPLGFVLAVKRSRGCNSNAALIELYGAQHARFSQLAQVMQRKNLCVRGFSLDLAGVQYHELKRAFVALQAAAQVFDDELRFVALHGIDAALLQDQNNCSNPAKFIEELRFRMRCFKVQHKDVKFTCDATRFVLKGTQTLTTRVIGSKLAYDLSGEVVGHQFYIDDGCYGAFSRSVLPSESVVGTTEEFKPAVTVLGKAVGGSSATNKTTIWGQTCDSIDLVLEDAQLPALSTDCWLSFNNMDEGCNTFCTRFNGFERAERRYFVSLAATA